MGFSPYNTDASIELIDSLSSNLVATSPVELTLNSSYSRHYSTLPRVIGSYYKPRNEENIEDMEKAKESSNLKIQNSLCQHIDTTTTKNEYHLFAIDVTPNKRPHAKKLADKGFVHINETVSGKKPVAIGHKYSCVAYLTQEKHWALPLSLNRVSTSEKETTFGVNQWCDIIKNPSNQFTDKPSIGVFDSAYSNAYSIYEFLTQTKGMEKKVLFIARLRSARVLMRPGNQETSGKKGRPVLFDASHPFRLDNSDTWGNPKDSTSVPWVTKRGKL